MIDVTLHHQPIHLEVDSGAACTLISEQTYHQTWRQHAPNLLDDDTHVKTWPAHALPLLGSADVDVCFNGTTCQLPLPIVRGAGSSLLGQNWFDALGITIEGINQATEENIPERQELVQRLQKKYEKVFAKDIPGHNGPLISLELHQDASPKFLKARPVPFAMRSAHDEEVRKLEQ